MKKKGEFWKEESWYQNLSSGGKYVADQIFENHEKYSKNDRTYRRLVRILKVIILFLAMCGTIVLGLKGTFKSDIPVIIGLCVSSLVTFLTAISSFFNLETYWIRNVRIHIQFNVLRDSFVYEAHCNYLTQDKIDYYNKEILNIEKADGLYWERNNNK